VVSIAVRGDKPKRADYESEFIDDQMWALLSSCWAKDPAQRPTIDRVLEQLMAITTSRGKLYSFA
jgi:hypothetical protein